MLVCSKCKREECTDSMVIYQGQVLCIICTLELIIEKLTKLNKHLTELRKALEGKSKA
jgi:hypothetical protein